MSPFVDVDRWKPQSWEQVVGNRKLVKHFKNMVRQIRVGDGQTGTNTLVFGPSRGGKTCTINLFARCIYCLKLAPDTLNPCDGDCKNCRQDVARYGLMGLEVDVQDGRRVHYLPVDCTAIDTPWVNESLTHLRDYDGVRLVWLDEAHRLARRFLDEKFLIPIEQRNFTWIVSTAKPEKLEFMFRKRFVSISTQLPTVDELGLWLGDRCREFEIDWDDEMTIFRLAELSGCSPGDAIKVLGRAQMTPDRLLTRGLVEDTVFETS